MEINQKTLIFTIGFGFLGFLVFKTLEASIVAAVIGFFISLYSD